MTERHYMQEWPGGEQHPMHPFSVIILFLLIAFIAWAAFDVLQHTSV